MEGLLGYAIDTWLSVEFGATLLCGYLLIFELSFIQRKSLSGAKVYSVLLILMLVQYYVAFAALTILWANHEDIFFLVDYWHAKISAVYSLTMYGAIRKAIADLGKANSS